MLLDGLVGVVSWMASHINDNARACFDSFIGILSWKNLRQYGTTHENRRMTAYHMCADENRTDAAYASLAKADFMLSIAAERYSFGLQYAILTKPGYENASPGTRATPASSNI